MWLVPLVQVCTLLVYVNHAESTTASSNTSEYITDSSVPVNQTESTTPSSSTSKYTTTSSVPVNQTESTTTSSSTSKYTTTSSDGACTSTCGIQQTGDSGCITSPNFPNAYPNDSNCTWRITAGNQSVVLISFAELFEIEAHTSGGCLDSVSVRDAGRPASDEWIFCGDTAPKSFRTETNAVIVQFTSDDSVVKKGFQLNWQATKPTWFKWWMLGAILGGVVLLVICIYCCCRRRQGNENTGENTQTPPEASVSHDQSLSEKPNTSAQRTSGGKQSTKPNDYEQTRIQIPHVSEPEVEGASSQGQSTSTANVYEQDIKFEMQQKDNMNNYERKGTSPPIQPNVNNRGGESPHEYYNQPGKKSRHSEKPGYRHSEPHDYEELPDDRKSGNVYENSETTPVIYEDLPDYDIVAQEYYNEELTIEDRQKILYRKQQQHASSTQRTAEQNPLKRNMPSVKQNVPGVMHLTDAPPDILPHLHIPRDRLKSIRKLGEGALAVTWEGRCHEHGKINNVVIKKTKLLGSAREHADARDDMLTDLQAVADITQHTNVVRLIGVNLKKEPDLLVVEFMAMGNLRDYLRGQVKGMADIFQHPDAAQLMSFAAQCAEGAAHVAKCGVVHHDLAARNIMLQRDDQAGIVCKVADYGFKRKQDMYTNRKDWLLTTRWFAPEILLTGSHSTESDVWAFGLLLWEIVTMGRVPYSPNEDEQTSLWVQQIVSTDNGGQCIHQPKHCTQPIYDLMLGCWTYRPEDRLTLPELVHKLCTLNDSAYVDQTIDTSCIKDDDLYSELPVFHK